MATQDTIFIKFKPAGDKELIRAIRTLNNAVKRTIQQQKLVNQRVSRNTEIVKQNTNQLKKQATMFQRLQSVTAVYRNKMLLLAFATTVVGGTFKKLADAAAELEEIMNKAYVVFGESMLAVEEWASVASDALGRSSTSLIEFAAGLQDTFVPLGMTRDGAANLSTAITLLALDVASFQNKTDADVVRDFQSALVGNHETVKKYGIIINEATLKQEAYREGLYDGQGELSEHAKMQARISLLYKGTVDAQGDLLRTQDSYTNSVKALGAAWKVVQEDFGNAIKKMIMPLIALAKHFANTKRLVAYLIVLGAVGVAFVIVKIKALLFAKSLNAVKLALIKSTAGLFLLVIVVAEVIAHLLGANEAMEKTYLEFDYYRDVLNENAEAWDLVAIKIRETHEANVEYLETVRKSAKGLTHQLEVLYATSEYDKKVLKVTKDRKGGVEGLTTVEDRLIRSLIRKKEVLALLEKQEKSAFKDTTAAERVALRALFEERKFLIDKVSIYELEKIKQLNRVRDYQLGIEQFAEESILIKKQIKTNVELYNEYADSIMDAYDDLAKTYASNEYWDDIGEANRKYGRQAMLDTYGWQDLLKLDADATQDDVDEAILILTQSYQAILNAHQKESHKFATGEGTLWGGMWSAETRTRKKMIKGLEEAKDIMQPLFDAMFGSGATANLLDYTLQLEQLKDEISLTGDPTGEVAAEIEKLDAQLDKLISPLDDVNSRIELQTALQEALRVSTQTLVAESILLEKGLNRIIKATGGVTFSTTGMLNEYLKVYTEMRQIHAEDISISTGEYEKLKDIFINEEVEKAMKDSADLFSDTYNKYALKIKEDIDSGIAAHFGIDYEILSAFEDTVTLEELFLNEKAFAEISKSMSFWANEIIGKEVETLEELEAVRSGVLDKYGKQSREFATVTGNITGGWYNALEASLYDLIDSEEKAVKTTIKSNYILSEENKKKIKDQAETNVAEQAELEAKMDANFAAASMIAAAWIQSAQQSSQAKIQGLQAEARAELASLRETQKFKRASDKDKKKMEDAIQKDSAKQIEAQFEKQQLFNRASVIMDTAMAIMKVTSQEGIFAPPWIAAITALGALQLETINSQQPPKAQFGGLIGGRRHSAGGTLIEAESVEYIVNRDAVNSVGLSTLNRINRGESSSNVNVTFSGNILTEDFIENDAIPAIKEAIRRGADIGIG